MIHVKKNEAITKCQLLGKVNVESRVWEALWKEAGLVGCVFITYILLYILSK